MYIAGFAELLREFGQRSGLVARMRASGESLDQDAPSLVAALGGKSTSTLAKRLCSVRLWRRWFRDCERPFLICEANLFDYCVANEAAGGPASRPQTLREALAFMHGVFELDVAGLDSSRVKGAVIKVLDRRGMLRQRTPLFVPMVRALEKAAADAHHPDGLLAGSLCFALFG